MRSILKSLFVFAFVAGATVVFTSKGAKADGLPVVSEEAAESRSLYRAHCAVCHGNDGHSNTKRGRETEADDISGTSAGVDKIIRVITNGKGDMPGFKKKLSSANIASIANYVKTL